jgi:hypothetical protein
MHESSKRLSVTGMIDKLKAIGSHLIDIIHGYSQSFFENFRSIYIDVITLERDTVALFSPTASTLSQENIHYFYILVVYDLAQVCTIYIISRYLSYYITRTQ